METRILAEIPSPTQGVWHLGPVPVRAYALCIVLGIIVACVITDIRMRRRGAAPYTVLDLAVWTVPAGIIGARIYHVITSPGAYFGAEGNPLDAFKIWQGGLGIWGAVVGGALGAWIACRRLGLSLTFVADAVAPGLPLAQAIGRLGNWFNNELYGRETTLPWGLRVYEWDAAEGRAVTEIGSGGGVVKGVFHPTFLYELLWCVGVALLVWLLDRRFRYGRGRAFALYVTAYCVGRFWIESLRIDEATQILGMRLNNWTSLLVFLGALAYFVRVRGPRERVILDQDGTMRMATEGAGDAVPGAGPDAAAPNSGAEAGATPNSGAEAGATPAGTPDGEPVYEAAVGGRPGDPDPDDTDDGTATRPPSTA